MISDQEKHDEVVRELRMRRRVYPRWIAEGRIDASVARRQIEVMEAIADDYRTKSELPL